VRTAQDHAAPQGDLHEHGPQLGRLLLTRKKERFFVSLSFQSDALARDAESTVWEVLLVIDAVFHVDDRGTLPVHSLHGEFASTHFAYEKNCGFCVE
jgi:hypothetical protein